MRMMGCRREAVLLPNVSGFAFEGFSGSAVLVLPREGLRRTDEMIDCRVEKYER